MRAQPPTAAYTLACDLDGDGLDEVVTLSPDGPDVTVLQYASGAWTATPRRPLPDGRYRAVAMAYSKALHTRPAYAIVPMAPMGRFAIGKDRSS